MTNQEAIEHLKTIMIFSYQDGYTAEAREALDMAIKSLGARWPCDKCIYNSPSSMGRKPCSCCPAEPYREEE